MSTLRWVNVGLVWTAITTTVTAMLWAFSTFAKAEDVQRDLTAIEVDVAYGQFYDRLDDYEEALDEDRLELADEYLRQMERLRAKICAVDPEWERCDDE